MPKSLMVLAFTGSNRIMAAPNFMGICPQNRPLKNFHKEKSAKKKGAANNLIFYSRINGGFCAPALCLCRESSRVVP